MPSKNNWYVITGGPATGKTTLLAELEKLGHAIVPEAARAVIDEALARGTTVRELRADEKRFQEDVARMKQSIEHTLDRDALTFFDRGMHDTLAYMRHYSYAVDEWIVDLMQAAHYKKVFLLDQLPDYEQDYARTEDGDFRTNIHSLLHNAYTEYGMKPIIVPAMSLKKRLQFILGKTQENT
jgi:predicted ATPase